jgi:hypothetical protein
MNHSTAKYAVELGGFELRELKTENEVCIVGEINIH